MSKLSNILTMVKLLQTGKKYSVKELSDILEVSERMIRIYKDDLEKSGIYIDTIRGPYGGYILFEPIKLPSIRFSDNDISLLNELISQEKNKTRKDKIITLQEKINGVYITNQIKPSKLNLSNEELKKFNSLTKAIKEKRKVRILYYSYGKGDNSRIIDPAEMFLFNDGWYCAAFCELKKDIRHFELKRIKEYELLDEMYK